MQQACSFCRLSIKTRDERRIFVFASSRKLLVKIYETEEYVRENLGKNFRKWTNSDFPVSLLQKAKLVSNMWNKGNIFVETIWRNEIVINFRKNICCRDIFAKQVKTQIRAAAWKNYWFAQIWIIFVKIFAKWKFLDYFRAQYVENLSNNNGYGMLQNIVLDLAKKLKL